VATHFFRVLRTRYTRAIASAIIIKLLGFERKTPTLNGTGVPNGSDEFLNGMVGAATHGTEDHVVGGFELVKHPVDAGGVNWATSP
jgi:hypothetical protein